MKRKLFVVISAFTSVVLSIPILLSTSNISFVKAIEHYSSFELTFNDDNPLTSGNNESGNKIYKTTNNNDILFSFENISYKDGCFALLEDGSSYFKNDYPINGLVSVDYVIGSGTINIQYGWVNDDYEITSPSISTSGSYFFNEEYPSYFRINCENKTSLVSLHFTYSCVEAINPHSDLSIPEDTNPIHSYHEKEYSDFPTFTDEDATPGLAYTLSEDGSYYIVDNYLNTMELGEDNMIIFPNMHNGKPVKRIGRTGFVERWWIFGIYIPRNIEIIDNEAFSMTGLTTVYWNARNCSDFAPRNAIFHPGDSGNHQNIDLVFGPDVERIPARMLYPTAMDPTKLPRVHSISFSLNSKVKSIGDYAFYGVNGISHIYLPDTIEEIGDYAFYNLGVDEVDLPSSLKSIGDYAFMFTDARYVNFPNTLQSIGVGAFNYAENLIDVDLKNTGINNIPDNAFSNCSNLSYFHFPTLLENIGNQAFISCTSLSSIAIPNYVINIGFEAFKGCEEVNYIYLGHDLSHIGNSAFEGLVNVSKLVIQSVEIDNFDNNNKVFLNLGKDVDDLLVFFKYGVEAIPQNFFYPSSLYNRLPNIATLVLPSTLTSVGIQAFNSLDISLIEYYGNEINFNSIIIGYGNDCLNNAKVRGN